MTFFFTSIFVVLVFMRPQEWLVRELYGWPLLDGVCYMALLSLAMEIRERRLQFSSEIPQPLLLVGLFFAAMMGHVINTFFAMWLVTVEDLFKICSFTILLFCVLDRPARLRAMARIFVIVACAMAVHALMQKELGFGFAGQRPIPVPGKEPGEVVYRSLFFGIFEDPNDLAQMLATAIPFAFVVFRRLRPLTFVCSCGIAWLLVSALLATGSRGGLVALIVVGTIVLALRLPARWLPGVLLLTALSGLALCPFAGVFLDESAHDRVVFWGQANRVFKTQWMFGIGYGMFQDYISESRAAHNAFVLCYTELGLFGYWFWYLLIHLGLVGAWRTRIALRTAASEDEKWMYRFCGFSLAAMCGFLVSAYFLTRAFVFPLFFLCAMLGVLPLVLRRIRAEAESGEDVRPPPVLVNWRRDVLVTGSIGVAASVAYVYVSVVLLNKAFYG